MTNNKKMKVEGKTLPIYSETNESSIQVKNLSDLDIKEMPINTTVYETEYSGYFELVQVTKVNDSTVKIVVTEVTNYDEYLNWLNIRKYAEIKPASILKHSKYNATMLSSTFEGSIYTLKVEFLIDLISDESEDEKELGTMLEEISQMWLDYDLYDFEGVSDILYGYKIGKQDRERKLILGDLVLESINGISFPIKESELLGISIKQLPNNIKLKVKPKQNENIEVEIRKISDGLTHFLIRKYIKPEEWESPLIAEMYTSFYDEILNQPQGLIASVIDSFFKGDVFCLKYYTVGEGEQLDAVYSKVLNFHNSVEAQMNKFDKTASDALNKIYKIK